MHSPIIFFIVEDHDTTRQVLEIALRLRGYNVISAAHYADALTMGLTQEFDLLVCDIELLDGTGTDLLKELRKNKVFPAIAVSGWCSEQYLEWYRQVGFDDCLGKPYSLLKLIAISKELIRRYYGEVQDEQTLHRSASEPTGSEQPHLPHESILHIMQEFKQRSQKRGER